MIKLNMKTYVIVGVAVALFGWLYQTRVHVKEKQLSDVTKSAITKYGYDTNQYKFELKDKTDNDTIKILKVSYFKDNKTWDIDCSRKSVDEWSFYDNYNDDSLKFESALRVFRESFRIYGFYSETEKVKAREATKEFLVKYPFRKPMLQKLDALLL